MAKTEIIKTKGSWNEVLNDCRSTVGKQSTEKEPSSEFKKRILIAEHSPIRDISIKWEWKNIKSWIATHFSRHKWECFIRTQRTDRTGIDRNKLSQGELVTFVGEANTQNLIDTMRKRLCCQAADETREYAEDLKIMLHAYQPEISDVLVPNCIYRGGCPEMKMCERKLWANFLQWGYGKYVDVRKMNIEDRYKMYNTWFREEWCNRCGGAENENS